MLISQNKHIKTVEEYFELVQHIKDADAYTLKQVINCFKDLLPQAKKGLPQILHVKQEESKNEVIKLIEMIIS